MIRYLDSNTNQMEESFKLDLERTGDKDPWRMKRYIPTWRHRVGKGGSGKIQ